MMSPSSASLKFCFNPDCKDSKSEQWRKGWRRRSGDFADLCDRCGSAYDEVRFCELFHNNAAGWRNCESCGKRVHCGCVASVHCFLLLDAGGIECMGCAKKSLYKASNHLWHSSLLFPPNLPEKLKDLSVKNWSQIHGHVSAPGQWRQTTNDKEKVEDLPERLKLASLDRLAIDSRKGVGVEPGMIGTATGLSFATHPSSCANIPLQPSIQKDNKANSAFGISLPSVNDIKEPIRVTGSLIPRQVPPLLMSKQLYNSPNNLADTSGEIQNHVRNGRLRAEARGRNQLLPRYWPRITDQELQQISGDSNSTITPLFEKMLSASDAGRIGRLVLPKKCAEAYFPTISQPEGLPLKVQDARGKEWVFQFRFWPNNNSRMYVLEGVTPCIQSMQLQAGDIVTFSRMDPEGKLVMGFRKASSVPPEQDIQTSKTGNGCSTNGDANNRSNKPGESVLSLPVRTCKGGTESNKSTSQANPTDPTWTKIEKAGGNLKEMPGAKPFPAKRKNSILGSKSKRLRIENEDSIELKLTWEEAQGFLRPPLNHEPSIVVVEGHEFEEFEEAPMLGKPTFFTTNYEGERNQWAQCEDCSKWRKLPTDALLPSKWTCHANLWDHERSSCSAPEEVTSKQLENMFSAKYVSPKRKRMEIEAEKLDASEGLDTLANVAILGEDGSVPLSQATTKHPRHRPGCSCIVCIQPPSGKGPKHKQSCTCNVCLTVKRRFRTLMMRREKRLSEKEADTSRKKQHLKSSDKLEAGEDEEGTENNYMDNGNLNPEVTIDEVEATLVKLEVSSSPFKGQIDLNIQPEREEEPLSVLESSNMMKLLQDAVDSYPLENLGGPDEKKHGVDCIVELDSADVGGEILMNGAPDTQSEEDQPISEHPCKL